METSLETSNDLRGLGGKDKEADDQKKLLTELIAGYVKFPKLML